MFCLAQLPNPASTLLISFQSSVFAEDSEKRHNVLLALLFHSLSVSLVDDLFRGDDSPAMRDVIENNYESLFLIDNYPNKKLSNKKREK